MRKFFTFTIFLIALGAGMYTQRVEVAQWYRGVTVPALPEAVTYEEVAEVYLVAVRKRVWDPKGGLSSVLPCPACWSALCAIHAQRVEATGGAKGLTVHVSTWSSPPDAIPPHLEGTLNSALTLLLPGPMPALVMHTFP